MLKNACLSDARLLSGVVSDKTCKNRFCFRNVRGLEVLPLGISVFAIDVTPTRNSQCCFDDVECAVGALRDGLPGVAPVSCIALWGRSAGAVAALQYASKEPCL